MPSKKRFSWLNPNLLAFVLLVGIITFLCWKNYSPGTWLSGWDNLHPELNFKLNITRSLNAAWQEYQGVGLLGGMAHAADLPRQIFLWLASFLVPVSLLRYFWTFLMLFTGPLGVYLLMKQKHSTFAALTSSIFYIFNLATVQYFYLPFETFIGFYGFLPWLIFFATQYLTSGKKLGGYFLLSIAATSAFYVQTLFLVYLIFLLVFCLEAVLKEKKEGLIRSIKIFFVTLVANAFWLLPVSWFSLTSSQIPINAQINRIVTPETVYMNQARENFSDIANFKGYWFDYFDFSKDGQFDYLFKDWINYTDSVWFGRLGVAIFVLSALGLLLNYRFAWLLLLGIAYLMLAGFRFRSSLLEEAFRNSFTKWSVAFAFVVSLGLGALIDKFKKFSFAPALLIIGVSLFMVLPVWQGKLISDRVRVKTPVAYSKTFDWFNYQSSGERVAFFPAFDKWGWNYHDWGYSGSGFIWYGIKNPILDRAFNVWSQYNEGFYGEMAKAVIDNDRMVFNKTVDKYQIRYLLLDESIISPWGDRDLLKVDVIKKLADELGYKKVNSEDFLSVYETNIRTDNFVSAITAYTLINADLTYSPVDPVYVRYGDYVQSREGLDLPFVNFDSRGSVKISLSQSLNALIFENKNTKFKVILPVKGNITESFASDRGFTEPFNCDLKKKGGVEKKQLYLGREYAAYDGGVACDYFYYPDLKDNQAYVLRIKGENLAGRSLKIYLFNGDTKRNEIEELLPKGVFDEYYVVYPKTSGKNSGYTLNVETRSFGKIFSRNTIEAIEIIPFDIDYVTKLYIDVKKNIYQTGDLKVSQVRKFGTAFYRVEVKGKGLLSLGQGYEKGWIASSLEDGFKFKLLPHYRVNSWANGWLVDNQRTVYILFWPQVLEFLGIVIGLIALTSLLKKT